MCHFWSCILTRDGRVIWDKNTTSHETLIASAGLDDSKLIDRDFVRIEIAPINIFSKDRGDWRYSVDEEGTLPVWYEADTRHWEAVVWDAWGEAMQQTLWAAPWYDRMMALVDRIKALRLGDATVSHSTVKAALEEYRKRLSAVSEQKRYWSINEVRFYTPAQWDSAWASVLDSVRASAWASVRASVRASVLDSVWDSAWASVLDSAWASVCSPDEENYGLPLIGCLEAGCVLYGVSDVGVAHVIMFGKDGEQ